MSGRPPNKGGAMGRKRDGRKNDTIRDFRRIKAEQSESRKIDEPQRFAAHRPLRLLDVPVVDGDPFAILQQVLV